MEESRRVDDYSEYIFSGIGFTEEKSSSVQMVAAALLSWTTTAK